MKRAILLIGGASLALSSSLAWAGGPEDLLPPMFRDPPPAQTAPTPTPTQVAPRPTAAPRPAAPVAPSGGPAVPNAPAVPAGTVPAAPVDIALPEDFPTLEELEAMEGDEVNDLLGLRPKFDIPAAARRAVAEVGILSQAEGGFPVGSLASQPAGLVRAALRASDGPIVSRWGHILMRRALASRMDAPQGLSQVEFAALRAQALVNMGEGAVARAFVQDVDGSEYNSTLAAAAFDAYLATGDLLGMCPVARLQGELREGGDWEMLQAVCSAYLGEARSANRRLQRVLGTGNAEEIDVRLAQRFAGAAGEGSRAVNIEWEGVEELTPWRYSLARAVGEDIPDDLIASASSRYEIAEILIPATPLLRRVEVADTAASRGILSSAGMVNLYSQLWASDLYAAASKQLPAQLREAYVANAASERLAAMQGLWGDDGDYGRIVLTAYAAARLPVDDAMADDAGRIIASMLAAGLDRNAMLWSDVVAEGTVGWALLALAQPRQSSTVNGDAIDIFLGNDDSSEQRKSAFLVAGLAGLGRISGDDLSEASDDLGIDLNRSSAWSSKISRAAQLRNPALVSLLAGLGMQGTSWDQMTPRHLFYIVRSLDAVGLSAEARMIAAEAVARG